VPPTALKVINGAVLFSQIVVDPEILANGKGLTVIVAVAEAALLQVNPLDSCTLTKEYINMPGVLVVTVTVMLLPEDVTIDRSEPLFIL
jgi:hypothetical protein